MEWWEELYDDMRMREMFEKIPKGRTEAQVNFIQKVCNLKKGAKVLDLGCGWGRHSIELAKRGYEITGLEINPSYLEEARKRASSTGVKVEFVEKDMRKISFVEEFDTIILLWNSFGYFSDDENENLIKSIYNALKKEGYFVLEIINRDWIVRHFTAKNWWKLGDACEFARFEIVPTFILEERKFIPEESRVREKITYIQGNRRIEKTTNFRFYSYHEIRAILKSTGFRKIQSYGSLEETPIELDTHLMEIIGRKL